MDDERVPDVRMAGVDYTRVRLRPPFSVRVPLGDDWRLYLVRGADVVFDADDAAQTRHRLPSGSVIALSGVLQHRFSSLPDAGERAPDVRWVEEGAPTATSAPSPGSVVVTMGRIAKSRMAFLALFERVIVLSADQYPEITGRVSRAIDWIMDESAQPSPASEAIIRRLAEITALEIGRFDRATSGAKEPSMRQAASDRRIMRAISAFYASPQEKWSLERLAEVAGMSRTAFAIRFRELIGTTPLKSVRQLRLQIAADQLSAPGAASVDLTAKRVGYASNATFIRAFSKAFGATPGEVAKLGKR